MATKQILSCFAIFLYFSLSFLSTIADDDEYNCVYTVYTRTSKTWHAGTQAKISVAFYDDTGSGVLIKDLAGWGGLMGKDHEYYQYGNLDIFSGRGPCLEHPVCYMELKSDGSGPHHGWYCNYVEVTTTGPHIPCAQKLFTVEQWLATNRSPYELTAKRGNCTNSDGLKRRRPFESLLPVETLLASSSLKQSD